MRVSLIIAIVVARVAHRGTARGWPAWCATWGGIVRLLVNLVSDVVYFLGQLLDLGKQLFLQVVELQRDVAEEFDVQEDRDLLKFLDYLCDLCAQFLCRCLEVVLSLLKLFNITHKLGMGFVGVAEKHGA